MDNDELEKAMAETVEQGFNDSELEDIMNEIESLEKEFVDDSASEGPTMKEELSLDAPESNSLQNVIDQEVENAGAETEIVTSESESQIDDAVDSFVDDVEVSEPAAEQVSMSEEVESEPVMEEVATTEDSPVMEEETTFSEEDFVEETIDNVVPLSATSHEAPTMSSVSSDGATDMSFSASGKMNMNMTFPVGEEQATFSVVDGKLTISMNGLNLTLDGSEGCTVEMESGVKFTIPLTSDGAASTKKAA
ncbi:hypothetical protein HBN50_11920 [Halobacteriovorax sp. GB3]|uniref:hypothetical protein n=1 Tax=Halobacteriovorax sp. GB3 TaxID=2719615 RepID=UPI00235EAFE9|nr:hypothetical protein [Halobacteriovorax sp. GB3]MDD0853808.1 hypothetical protein [Halobacteriovorax sp. GB3]